MKMGLVESANIARRLIMETFKVRTSKRKEMVDITEMVQMALTKTGITTGLCGIYVPHTTCAITVNEGADPSVAGDIIEHLSKLVPERGSYRHAEGNSDSHILATLTGSSQIFLVEAGRIQLGTWQRIFLCEFDGPRTRTIWVQALRC